jgi:hypothetical protein
MSEVSKSTSIISTSASLIHIPHHRFKTRTKTLPGLLKLKVAPSKQLSLTNFSNSSLPLSEPSGPHALTSAPLNTVANTAANSTCANFIPGHTLGPDAQGAYPSGGGMRDSLARMEAAGTAEERVEVEIQRFGFQTEGEGKVEGFVCMPWMLRVISVLSGRMMVVV